MLEFIVLGQVPGTNFYITFTAISVVAMVVTAPLAAVVYKKFAVKYKQSKITAKAL